jgi:hypothetical protein
MAATSVTMDSSAHDATLRLRACAFCAQRVTLSDPSAYCADCALSRQRIARRYFARQSVPRVVGNYIRRMPRDLLTVPS